MRRFFKQAIIVAGVTLAAGCAESPEGTEAEVSEAKEIKMDSAGIKYMVDIQQSNIEWIGSKPTRQHSGFVKLSEGTLSLKDGKITGGNFIIDMNTIEGTDQSPEDNKDLSDHLKDEDFFRAAKYPAAKFEITQVEPLNAIMKADSISDESIQEKAIEGVNFKVTGNLAIMDSVKSISFPAKISVSENQIFAEANFNINRTHWGIKYKSDKSPGNKFIYHTVNIGIKLAVNKE